MQDSTKKTVTSWLKSLSPETVLDCPAGNGWLLGALPNARIDGIDLYADSSSGYRKHIVANLDDGIPSNLPEYDVIACCEGIEHFGNPKLFFRTCHNHLKKNGTLLITTPNTWQPSAKLQFNIRGFFPGFPCLIGKISKGSHMHIMPWSFPQLYLFLSLSGFKEIQLHTQPLSQPRHSWEKLLAIPQKMYCKSKSKKSSTHLEKDFWNQAGSDASTLGRNLFITAKKV